MLVMFKSLFKKSSDKTVLQLYAPLNGKIMPLEDVPDPVFGEKMMGEGIAITPDDGKVISPVEGKIVQVPKTKHAVGIETADGTEILIHIGLETVSLKGEGFTMNVSMDEQVSVGDSLIEFDLNYVKENADSSITPIVITNTNTENKAYKSSTETQAKAGETVIMTVSDK